MNGTIESTNGLKRGGNQLNASQKRKYRAFPVLEFPVYDKLSCWGGRRASSVEMRVTGVSSMRFFVGIVFRPVNQTLMSSLNSDADVHQSLAVV